MSRLALVLFFAAGAMGTFEATMKDGMRQNEVRAAAMKHALSMEEWWCTVSGSKHSPSQVCAIYAEREADASMGPLGKPELIKDAQAFKSERDQMHHAFCDLEEYQATPECIMWKRASPRSDM